jgi:hypothetical protein
LQSIALAKSESHNQIRHYQEKRDGYNELMDEEKRNISVQASVVESKISQALEHCQRVNVTQKPEKLERMILQMTERIKEKEKEYDFWRLDDGVLIFKLILYYKTREWGKSFCGSEKKE